MVESSVANSPAVQNATDKYNAAMERLNSGEDLSEQEIIALEEQMRKYAFLMEALSSVVKAEGEAEKSAAQKMA